MPRTPGRASFSGLFVASSGANDRRPTVAIAGRGHPPPDVAPAERDDRAVGTVRCPRRSSFVDRLASCKAGPSAGGSASAPGPRGRPARPSPHRRSPGRRDSDPCRPAGRTRWATAGLGPPGQPRLAAGPAMARARRRPPCTTAVGHGRHLRAQPAHPGLVGLPRRPHLTACGTSRLRHSSAACSLAQPRRPARRGASPLHPPTQPTTGRRSRPALAAFLRRALPPLHRRTDGGPAVVDEGRLPSSVPSRGATPTDRCSSASAACR